MASLESGLECRDCRWRRNGRREGDCVCEGGGEREGDNGLRREEDSEVN